MLQSKSIRLTVGLLLAAASASALAQQAPAGDNPTPATDSGALQEVVVTAQFQKQSVQNTPLAITAISGDTLAERGQTNIAQVAAQVPSLTLTPPTSAYGPSMVAYIRGVGQYDQDPALEPGVGIYLDDVYMGTLTGSLMDLLDLDRVEVLRGPQGTLEGMNSEGGAVKLFSKQPDANTATTLDALYGSRNHIELRGSTNFTLVPDHLFVRMSAVGNRQDGYEDVMDFGCANPSFNATSTNGVTGAYSVAPGYITTAHNCLMGHEGGTSYAAGRLALRWVINDRLDATITGDISNQNNELPAETLLYAAPVNVTIPAASGPAGSNLQLPYDSSKVPAMIPGNRYTTYTSFCMPAVSGTAAGQAFSSPAYCIQNNQQLNSWGVSGVVNWTVNDWLSVKNILAERAYSSTWGEDNDASPWPVGLGNEAIRHHQFSEELRLSGKWNSLMDFTLGGFYFNERSVYATHQDLWYAVPADPGSFDFTGNDPITAHDKAVYLHTVWHLLPKLDFTAATRYTWQDKTYTFSRLDPYGNPGGTAFMVAGLNGVSSNYSGDRADWRGVLDYHWTDSLMTYAQVSTGFKGGGVNPRPFFQQQAVAFQPETLTNYEGGIKSTWFDNHVRVNLDGFYSQYRNVQLTLNNCGNVAGIPDALGTPCALPFNAGSANESGVEFETQGKFGGFEVDGSFSYLDFRYGSDLNPYTGVTQGMITPYTPKWQGSLGLQYTMDLARVGLDNVGAVTGRIDGNTRTKVYTNAVNGPTNRIGGYTTYNAHLTWEPEQGNYSVTVQALNLTGKVYYLSLFDLSTLGGGSVTADPAPPREIDLEVKYHF